MIVDSSAIIAILTDEDDAHAMRAAILHADSIIVSAATLLESHLVMRGRYGEAGPQKVDVFLASVNAVIASVSEEQARKATVGHARYGRGSGSPAKLNYGDCFSYALAMTRDEPLLFKGDDFIHTDVRVAI
ncbi:type II toxin-antitoxin system VapC family toxin [Microbacterium sp.]|uniref:type II toxin-antitoxin system VapC family toxin n=1 Tax=Microbacterium sp. TaxID=51671 RepID=UPI003F9C1439